MGANFQSAGAWTLPLHTGQAGPPNLTEGLGQKRERDQGQGCCSLPELRPHQAELRPAASVADSRGCVPHTTLFRWLPLPRILHMPCPCFTFLHGTCHHPPDHTLQGPPSMLVGKPHEGRDIVYFVHLSSPAPRAVPGIWWCSVLFVG